MTQFNKSGHDKALHRLFLWMPHVASIIDSVVIGFFCALLMSMLLAFFSINLALSPLCLWIVLLAYRIEWQLVDRLVLPPLSLIVLPPAVGLGIGVPLYLWGLNITYSYGLLVMQVTFLVSMPLLFIGYRVARGKVELDWSPQNTAYIFDAHASSLLTFAWFLFAFDLTRIAIGWRTGNLDRGFAGDEALDNGLSMWTLISIFARWGNLWFFLLPLMWRYTAHIGRLIIICGLCFYSLIAFASGSRGLLIYPAIFFISGSFFFIDRPRIRVERWIPFAIALCMVYIYIMDVYRNTAGFQNTRLTDISARLSATYAISHGLEEREDFSLTTGRALIGVADEIVYEMTPSTIPFAGASDILPAVLWTWVPQRLAPSKPMLWDSNEVVVYYTGSRSDRSYSAISLTADLYRRFGWAGIPIGWFLMGCVFGLAVRGVLYVYKYISIIAGVGLIVFMTGGVSSGNYTSTVLQTWWIWAYDLPKHLVPLGVIIFLIGRGFGCGLNFYIHGKQPTGTLMKSAG